MYGEDANWGRILCAVYVQYSPSVSFRPLASATSVGPRPDDSSCFAPGSSGRGYTDLPEGTISPTSVTVSFVPSAGVADSTPLRLLTNGEPEPNIDEARASEILAEEDLEVVVDLGVKGGEEARVWTCDFSHVSPASFSLTGGRGGVRLPDKVQRAC